MIKKKRSDWNICCKLRGFATNDYGIAVVIGFPIAMTLRIFALLARAIHHSHNVCSRCCIGRVEVSSNHRSASPYLVAYVYTVMELWTTTQQRSHSLHWQDTIHLELICETGDLRADSQPIDGKVMI